MFFINSQDTDKSIRVESVGPMLFRGCSCILSIKGAARLFGVGGCEALRLFLKIRGGLDLIFSIVSNNKDLV